MLGPRHTLSTPEAQRCAPPDYFGVVTNPVSAHTKIVPRGARAPVCLPGGRAASPAARGPRRAPYVPDLYSRSPVCTLYNIQYMYTHYRKTPTLREWNRQNRPSAQGQFLEVGARKTEEVGATQIRKSIFASELVESSQLHTL